MICSKNSKIIFLIRTLNLISFHFYFFVFSKRANSKMVIKMEKKKKRKKKHCHCFFSPKLISSRMTSYLLKLRLPATSLVRAAPLMLNFSFFFLFLFLFTFHCRNQLFFFNHCRNNQHVLRNLSLFETPFSMNITRDYVHSIEPSVSFFSI